MYKLLIIADVPGWAYDRRMRALAKHAPEDFQVDTTYHKHQTQVMAENQYDAVFCIDFTGHGPVNVLASRHQREDMPIIFSWNRDHSTRIARRQRICREINQTANNWLIVNNRKCWDTLCRERAAGRRTCNISNGLDLDLWGCDVPMRSRSKKIIWCGSSNPKKEKGYHDILARMTGLEKHHDFQLDLRPYASAVGLLDADEMRDWYNSAAIVIVASRHEGTPNISLEGMACGCVLVTTRVGNVLEFGEDRVNCVMCERELDSLQDGCLDAWERREQISQAGMETMQQWSYGEPGNRAEYFYQLFRRLIRGEVRDIKPFSYMDKHWSEI